MTSEVFLNGGRLPVLLLRRGGNDAERLRRHLRRSTRVDVAVVGPDALLRVPVRWPQDPAVQPLAMAAYMSERPGALASTGQLVRRLGDLPLIVVTEGSRAFAVEMLESGAEEVLEVEHLSGPALEQSVVSAIARRVGRVLTVGDVPAPVELGGSGRGAPSSVGDPLGGSLAMPG